RLAPAVKRALAESRERAERRTAEKQIREQAALLDKAHDSICVTDLTGRILYWNYGSERLYGWTREEAVQRTINDLLFPLGQQAEGLDALKGVVSRGEWKGQLTQVTRNKNEVIVEGSWT